MELEKALYEKLLGHVEFLESCEPNFGHAAALAKYGRRFLPRPIDGVRFNTGPKGACFKNATAEALARTDVFYVEGYAIEERVPVPVQHAWLVNGEGSVIDPTWGSRQGSAYFGIPFTQQFVASSLTLTGDTAGILVNMHLIRIRYPGPQALETAIANGIADIAVTGKI